MIDIFSKYKTAIVGAGKFGHAFLKFLFSEDFRYERPRILGVADEDAHAEGLKLARALGIYTTTDYRDFYDLEELELILELSNDPTLSEQIQKTKPPGVLLVDHFDARTLWDFLMIREFKEKSLEKFERKTIDPEAVRRLCDGLTHRFTSIIKKQNDRSRVIEKELFEHERTLSQIIQGSTIPTFVIDKNHRITHWNKAMEKLTAVCAKDVVGTNRQWLPFYEKERYTMADVIVDQIAPSEIEKLYGSTWNKSALIEGAYQAENYFPNLGGQGKWCLFTAAPIKAPDGKIIGAIETLWDKTEDRRVHEEQERYTRELSELIAIYEALSAPVEFEERIDLALNELLDFLKADAICVFLLGEDGFFHRRYTAGMCNSSCCLKKPASPDSVIHKVAVTNQFTIYDEVPKKGVDEVCRLKAEQAKSLAYVPICNKENNPLGVIRIASVNARHFSNQKKDILELIGNRIGVAIENAILQERYIKSEEKYRTLFNNDPNPIFIIDCKTYEIMDMNQRARDSYGYELRELWETSFLELGDTDDEELRHGLDNLPREHSILFSKKRHYKKGGHPFFVNISVSCANYGGTNVLIATTTDITESVEKETQLIQASKMTTLGVMAAGMAHEINQPLNVIQICADIFMKMLKRGVKIKDEDLRHLADEIVENVDRASKVIKHVRDFARQSEVVRHKLNINEPINDVFKVLGHQLKVHQIELDLRLDEFLPPIMADHNRIEQVFINLVTNAIDAMDEKSAKEEGKKSHKLLSIRTFSENGHVAVEVADTGIGMSDEVKEKLFEPFFTTKKTGKGTGLGISISYGIVKDYDGKIEIESKLGVGTTFKIVFPAAES